MIKLRVLDGPNESNEHRCEVEETDKGHAYLFGTIRVDFTINNPETKITRGDLIVIDDVTVYTMTQLRPPLSSFIAREIISIEHS